MSGTIWGLLSSRPLKKMSISVMLCRLLVDYSTIYNIYLSPEREKKWWYKNKYKVVYYLYGDIYIYVSRINTIVTKWDGK